MFERYTGYPPNTRLIFVLTMGSTLLIAVFHKEDYIYVAECPEVGTVSQGYTMNYLSKSKGDVGIWVLASHKATR
jgi:hypothetical protein